MFDLLVSVVIKFTGSKWLCKQR